MPLSLYFMYDRFAIFSILDCNLDVILGFDVSDTVQGQNIFSVQRMLESTVEDILNRISQMQKISCTPNQAPTVRVALLAQTPSGIVEAFDFSEYQPELFEKFQALRNDGPYVLTADTLKSYQNKFKTAPSGSTKVNVDSIFIFGKQNPFAASKYYSTEHPLPPGDCCVVYMYVLLE